VELGNLPEQAALWSYSTTAGYRVSLDVLPGVSATPTSLREDGDGGGWLFVSLEVALPLTVVVDQFSRDVGRGDRMRVATSAFGGQ
jgi:hypothetical protein